MKFDILMDQVNDTLDKPIILHILFTFKAMLLSGSTAPPFKAALRFAVNFFFPELAYKLNLRTFDEDNLNFFIEIIKNSMNSRKERRNDFIDLLRDTVEELDDEKKKKINSENDITDYVIANGLMLFFVGNDTSSGALSLALHYMARYPDVQEKLYQEIQVHLRFFVRRPKRFDNISSVL